MAESHDPPGPLTRGTEGQVNTPAVAGDVLFGQYLAADPAPLQNRALHPVRIDDAGRLVTSGGSAFTGSVQQAVIEAAALGNNTLIAAPVAGNYIRILKLSFITRGNVNVRLLSNATALTGLMNLGTRQGPDFDFASNNAPLDCGDGEPLIANLDAAVGIDGLVQYVVEAV